MFQIIPAIGTVIALAAFFFAVYYRTVQKYSQISVDSIRSIGRLPTKSRLDATKVLVNVFDLDVQKLSPDQQYDLALRTFEKRERDSKRSFLLLISGGGVMLLFAIGYWWSQMDGGGMIRAAMIVDPTGSRATLNDTGYFKASDTQLVETLANSALVDNKIADPFERTEKFARTLERQPAVVALRERAERDQAPFQAIGDILNISQPNAADQPPRYIAYVRRNSPLAGRLVSIRTKGRDTYLRLFALGAVDSESRADVQLNSEQFKEVFGYRPNQVVTRALVTAAQDAQAVDPTCPRHPGFSITTCDLPARIEVNSIPARARR